MPWPHSAACSAWHNLSHLEYVMVHRSKNQSMGPDGRICLNQFSVGRGRGAEEVSRANLTLRANVRDGEL